MFCVHICERVTCFSSFLKGRGRLLQQFKKMLSFLVRITIHQKCSQLFHENTRKWKAAIMDSWSSFYENILYLITIRSNIFNFLMIDLRDLMEILFR